MPLISNGTSEQLPPWVTQPQKKKQASEVPWRKNLRSTGGPAATAAPPTAPTPKTNAKPPPAANAPGAAAAVEQQPPKTTKLQINLKSVKKPDTPTQPSQTDKLPPVQLNPVLPENKATPNKPPTGKTIPITIQKTVGDSPAPVKPPTVNTTTIPIQRPHNDQPPPLPAPQPANKKGSIVKTTMEGKVKSPKEGKVKATASSVPIEDKKMAPAPPPPAPPAPPPPPGAPPPPPPPPGGFNAGLPPKAPKPPQVVQKIEQLKKAPRKRPDWANMMKEIETGRKLKHVQCNDRSKPILPRTKSRGKFMFESEVKPASKSDALHNKLLNEIQSGIKLKKVQCNDRSKPILSGLRFRRQSSVADSDVAKVSDAIPEPEELAFVMDIDVLRDELQSAKQMLEMEIESKHNIEKKNRDQKCQIIAMEAEIDTLKAKLGLIPEDEVSMISKGLDRSESRTFKHLRKSGSGLWKSPSIAGIKKSKSGITKELLPKPPQQQQQQGIEHAQQPEEDLNEVNELEEEITSLKQSVQHARKQAEEMERKYKETMEKLLVAQGTLEDSEQKRKMLEKKLDTMQKTQSGNMPAAPSVQTAERTTQTEEQILDRMLSRTQSSATQNGGTGQDGTLFTDSEEEDSDMEVDEETLQRKKDEREIKLWENKYKSIKDKQHASRLERKNLKILQKKLEAELKEAKKRHKKLQKEVDKMAKMLKDVEKAEGEDEDGEGDDEEKEQEEPEETEEEEESEEEETEEEESESEEEDDDDEESSEEDDEEAGHEERLALYGRRVKRRENVLNALRKGNYLLRANIDRLKDDLEEARITYHDLEHELSSVLDDM